VQGKALSEPAEAKNVWVKMQQASVAQPLSSCEITSHALKPGL
jgi:hypothetical protein